MVQLFVAGPSGQDCWLQQPADLFYTHVGCTHLAYRARTGATTGTRVVQSTDTSCLGE